jgi:hypothetical protein
LRAGSSKRSGKETSSSHSCCCLRCRDWDWERGKRRRGGRGRRREGGRRIGKRRKRRVEGHHEFSKSSFFIIFLFMFYDGRMRRKHS